MFLSDSEILAICKPLTQPSALCRALRGMGFHVKERPNGWPLVSRANFDSVMMGKNTTDSTPLADETRRPNPQALLRRFGADTRTAAR
jgi:hypothetical protein